MSSGVERLLFKQTGAGNGAYNDRGKHSYIKTDFISALIAECISARCAEMFLNCFIGQNGLLCKTIVKRK